MTCEFEEEIERYHDGELDAAARATVDHHLLGCSVCAAHLAHLRHVTDRFETSFHRFELEMPSDFKAHLHRHVDEWMEGGLLKLAMSFASVAAVVLIAATIGLVQLHRPATEAPQSWESAAVALQSASSDSTLSSVGSFQVSSTSSSSIEPDVILADLSRKGVQ